MNILRAGSIIHTVTIDKEAVYSSQIMADKKITATWVTDVPSISQDSFWENYSNGRTLDEYLVGYKKLVSAMFVEFDTPEKRTAKIWVVPFNTGIDRTYNFPQTLVNVNSRNTMQVTKWTNGVHPDVSGYNQMGDMLWTFIKNLI